MLPTFSLNKAQYTTVGAILTIGVLLSLFLKNSVAGIVLFAAYSIFFGLLLGTTLHRDKKIGWNTFFGILMFLSSIVIAMSVIYWFLFFSIRLLAVIIAAASSIVLFYGTKKLHNLTITLSQKPLFHWLHGVLTGGYFVLFWRLFSRRLGDTLISPWTLFGPKFFLLFFVVTAFLLIVVQKEKYKEINIALIIVHYFLTIGVALIVYKHGFGFDPFIHEAAESVIQKTGFITPKQPYYIGQYMLTLLGINITHLSIAHVDQLLVPVTASILLPLCIYRTFRDRVKVSLLLPALLLLPFLPLSFFIFTTPHNLSLLIAALVIFIIHSERAKDVTMRLVGLILSMLCFVIHPLIGIPVLLLYGGHVTWQKKSLSLKALYTALLVSALPFVVWLNSIRTGVHMSVQNPLTRLQPFMSLFQKPHWFIFDHAPFLWKLLYGYRLIIIPLFILIAVVSMWKKRSESKTQFFALSIAAIFVSGFILSTAITFPDVISYEQGSYGARMLTLSLLLLMPFFILSAVNLMNLLQRNRIRWIYGSLACAILLTISWYFSYPTRDPVSLHTGYAVRDADIDVVHFIDNRSADTPYIVLTNQTVSAAAIKEKGFFTYYQTQAGPQFAYAVPTGGPLYQYFRKMVYEEPKREWMLEAMDFAGVDRAYFVHTNYWAPAATIRDEAKKEADLWWDIDNGRAWVYEYNR